MGTYRQPSYPAALNMARLIYLLATRSRSLTLREVLHILDISERTARRYLKAINDSLTTVQGEGLIKVIRLGGVEHWKLNEGMEVEATPYQLISLYVGAILMSFLEKTVIKDGLLDMVDTLEEIVPPAQRALLKNYQQKFLYSGFGSKRYESQDDQIDVILRGLLGQYQIEITYVSDKGAQAHRLHPYTLVLHGDSLYLNAFRKDIRNCAPSRWTRLPRPG